MSAAYLSLVHLATLIQVGSSHEDVQMMSCIGKHIRSEFGGSWGVVWCFWRDLLEGEHSEYCLFVWP